MKRLASDNDLKAPERVLVVEDDGILALAIEDALRNMGVADIQICSTTEEALQALRSRRPDAVVLDIHLADRDDGWAVAELVDLVGPNPPRIIFSTGSPEDIPDEIAQLGAILEKPYDPADLAELLAMPQKTGLFTRLRGALRA